jgi:excisionase family DNA binding protein
VTTAQPVWFTATEVAQTLRVGRTTIHRAITRGELRASKVGTVYRIHRDAITAYLGRHQ